MFSIGSIRKGQALISLTVSSGKSLIISSWVIPAANHPSTSNTVILVITYAWLSKSFIWIAFDDFLIIDHIIIAFYKNTKI